MPRNPQPPFETRWKRRVATFHRECDVVLAQEDGSFLGRRPEGALRLSAEGNQVSVEQLALGDYPRGWARAGALVGSESGKVAHVWGDDGDTLCERGTSNMIFIGEGERQLCKSCQKLT